MKRASIIGAFVAAAFSIATLAADSKIYKSDAESVFCTRLEEAQAFHRAMAKSELATAARLLQTDACAIVKPSLEVFITEDHGLVVGVRRVGMPTTTYISRHLLH